MYLYGKNSVTERLRRKPETISKIFIKERHTLPRIEELIEKNSIAFARISSRKIDSIKRPKDHQGIIAQVKEFVYTDFNSLLKCTKAEKPVLIFLDRITDPQNLGVILRIAACFGGFAVVIPKFRACPVNETVLHVACGGENYIPVSLVSNIVNSIIKAKQAGFWIAGAIADKKAEELTSTALPFPLGLVFGSEGTGLRKGIKKHLDIDTYIPMTGAELSFNVATACAVYCYEIFKQRGVQNEKKEA